MDSLKEVVASGNDGIMVIMKSQEWKRRMKRIWDSMGQ